MAIFCGIARNSNIAEIMLIEMSDKQQVKFHCIAFAFVFTESQDNLA